MGLRWFMSMAGLLLAFAGQANAATETTCAREQRQLEQWEQQTVSMDRQVEPLQRLLDGTPIAPDTLNQALGAPADAANRPPPGPITPPSLSCEQLEERLNQAVTERRGVRALLDDQRDQWFSLSRQERAAALALLEEYQSLTALETDPLVPSGPLRDHLTALIALLPPLRNQPANAARQIDVLWPPPVADIQADIPAPQRLALWRHHYETRRQQLALRSGLWQRQGVLRLWLSYAPAEWLPLLGLEARMTVDRLHQGLAQTYREWTLNREIRHYTPLVSNALAVILGLAILALVMQLGRRGRRALLRLHERLVSRAGQKRWLWNASRLLSGIAPLVPWLLLWLVIHLLAPLLDSPSTQVVRWLLPLARLYVLFGLLWLFGEWLVFRVCQSAHSYLNDAQITEASALARRQALWMMLPWALWFAVDRLIGQSLIGLLCTVLVGVCLYIAIGRLLAFRRDDYLLCLQNILPSVLDPVAERLLKGLRFGWTAPVLLPVALVNFLFHYLDMLLGELDWYLRLKARWFRLRTKGVGEDEEPVREDTSEAGKEYQKWFANQLPDDQETPFIDTGLLNAMIKAVEQWHSESVEENALLVTGEKGSGKSMAMRKLVSKMEKEQPDLRLVTVSVPPRTVTPEAVTSMIADALGESLDEGPASLVKNDEQRPPTLLILDETQNCFLARIGGLEGWQTLLTLTNARLDNLFWLVLINNQSWSYLSNVFGRDYQFRRVIKVKRWDQSEIRSLILSRHHLSKQKLRYDDLLLSSRGPEAGNMRNAEQRYFSLLWDACGGNPMVALKLWLTSIKVTPRQVLVGLPAQPSSALAAGQSGDSLMFVYAAIVSHENLSGDEIVAVTDLSENVVRSALKAGQDAGFIYKGEDSRYRVVPMWYRTVINQLNRKNLLHE
ncbi:hypothetical protein Q668_10190 [Alcanivorax sp. PN-3]|jgi:AAA domain-containing protein|nr:hypothetical protein Q668_10190 [Alcanivorax sp. PN-3]